MNLFELKKDKDVIKNVIKFQERDFRNENEEMHKIFDNNLKSFFDIDFIGKSYPVKKLFPLSSKPEYIIDALAISKDGYPVIIEYGRKNKSISQTFGYYNKFKANHWVDFEEKVKKEFGQNKKVNWDKIVILMIAKKIQKGEFETIEFIKRKDFNFHFFSYYYFDNYLILNKEGIKEIALDPHISEVINNFNGDKTYLIKLNSRISGLDANPYSYKNKLRYCSTLNGSLLFELIIEPDNIILRALNKQFKERIGGKNVDVTNKSIDEIIQLIKNAL